MRMRAYKGGGGPNFGHFCAYVLCEWPQMSRLKSLHWHATLMSEYNTCFWQAFKLKSVRYINLFTPQTTEMALAGAGSPIQ